MEGGGGGRKGGGGDGKELDRVFFVWEPISEGRSEKKKNSNERPLHFFFLSLAFVLSPLAQQAAAASERPNVLLPARRAPPRERGLGLRAGQQVKRERES